MKKQKDFVWVAIVLALSGLYLFTRFISIKSLPPFNDEFIYVRWAQQAFFDPSTRLFSLSDGKQPLFVWLTSIAMFLIPNPLAAGRIVSILSGLSGMLGLMVLSWQLLKNRSISIITSLLYIMSPYALLLDRFALYDSLLAALSIWSMVIMYHLVLHPTLGASLLLALFLGAAFLTKSSAVLLLVMLPLLIVIFEKNWKQRRTIFLYFLISVGVAYLYQSVQYLYPGDLVVSKKNEIFVYTLRELRTTPIVPLVLKNFNNYFGWMTFYLTPFLILLAAIPLFFDKTNRKIYTFLMLSFLVPFSIVTVIGKLLYPRHIFFFSLPLFIIVAAGMYQLIRKFHALWFKIAFVILCLFPVATMTVLTLADFKNAPLPQVSRFQYVDGWPAGWGVKEIVSYLEKESQKGDLTVLTEGVYGSMPTTAMRLYFGNYPQVHIVPIDDTKPLEIPKGLDWAHPVYFILNKQQVVPESWNATEVLKIQKGKGDWYIRLLKLAPSGR